MTKQHSGTGGHRQFQYTDVVIWLLLALVVAALVYPHWDGVLDFADRYLKLYKDEHDLAMIPVCGGLFFLLWKALDRTLFASCLQLMEKREAATTGAVTSAAEANRRADLLEEEYSEKIRETRIEETRKKLTQLSIAKQKAHSILRDATADAQRRLRQERSETEKQCQALREEIFAQVEPLVEEVVQKLKEPPRTAEHV